MSETTAQIVPAQFESAIGTMFDVLESENGPAATSLELVAVQAIPRPHGGRKEPFSVLFEGGCDPRIAQGTYLFSHPALGEMPLFIVPIQEQGGVRRYEAIFN